MYVDGFLIPIPAKNVKDYVAIARKACKVWMDHGALQYVEAVGEDLEIPKILSFPRGIKTKKGETVVFAYVVYKSRAHRDAVNKKVMADPRMNKMIAKGKTMPFDMKRMMYGGFRVIVEAKAGSR